MLNRVIEVSMRGTSRNELRRKVIDQFFLEEPGTEPGDYASKYIYYVERLIDDHKILLTRPA